MHIINGTVSAAWYRRHTAEAAEAMRRKIVSTNAVDYDIIEAKVVLSLTT